MELGTQRGTIYVVLLSEGIFLMNKCSFIVIFIFCFTLFHHSETINRGSINVSLCLSVCVLSLSRAYTVCFKPSLCSPSPLWICSASSNHLVAETQQITSEPS